MSTRANITVIDKYDDKLHFYQHADGYPKGVMPTLKKILNKVKTGEYRNNTVQTAGWLVIEGYMQRQKYVLERTEIYREMISAIQDDILKELPERQRRQKIEQTLRNQKKMDSWKVGFIEPASNISADIEYYYILDLYKEKILTVDVHDSDDMIVLKRDYPELYQMVSSTLIQF